MSGTKKMKFPKNKHKSSRKYGISDWLAAPVFILVTFSLNSCGFVDSGMRFSSEKAISEDRHVRSGAFPKFEGGRSLLFIADNQIHNIHTDASVFGLRISDQISRVAIRPAALNLFAPYLLSHIIKKNEDRTIVHLGDALNVACENEWQKFQGIMDESSTNGWIMAPGNHDFYFYGVTGGRWIHDVFRSTWSDGCVTANGAKIDAEASDDKYNSADDNRFDKGEFLDNYIDHLVSASFISQEGESEIGRMHARKSKTVGGVFQKIKVEKRIAKNDSGFYRKMVSQKYQNLRKHRSFITQFVNLSLSETDPVIGVILDTTNYKYNPTNVRGAIVFFSQNAGLEVYVGVAQKEVIRDSLNEFMDQLKSNSNDKLKVVFIGHHPFTTLNKDIQEYMFSLDDNDSDLTGQRVDEYNLGSVTDWPIQYTISDDNQYKVNSLTPPPFQGLTLRPKYRLLIEPAI